MVQYATHHWLAKNPFSGYPMVSDRFLILLSLQIKYIGLVDYPTMLKPFST